ncbi:MAG TPA: PIG-L family deacetylase [Terriglobia bacterium]|nr:PIG-L family deacetylase [Terriglobia bacterium]
MTHVFLSPHFDDAIGSCGGTISRLCRASDHVTVHTIFAGHASPPYSALATRLHAEWCSGDSPVAVRRLEDARACRVLGCRARYSDWLDAIYRRPTATNSALPVRARRPLLAPDHAPPDDWLYPDHAALFGVVAARDRSLPARIARQLLASIQARNARHLADTRFYTPLGVGHHVDHVLAFLAGRELQARGADVRFYQDFFYTDWNCPHLAELRRRAHVALFSAADFARKLRAFQCYRSQIPTLFGSAARAASYFAEANRQASRGSAYCEIFWQVEQDESASTRPSGASLEHDGAIDIE